MKISKKSFLLALMASVGFGAACSADGTGAVPPGTYATAGAPGPFGGTMGTVVDSGGTVAAGGSSSVEIKSSADSGGAGSSTVQAGTPAASTSPSAGSTAITTIPSGGNSGTAGASKPSTTAVGGSTGGGRTATAGTIAAGGTTAEAGSTARGGTIAAGGTTGAGGTTARTGGTTAAGGAGGSASTGTGASNWWPTAYDANVSPNGKHNVGKACLSCHKTGGQGPAWLFGGTIYDQAGSTGVGHVQVGIKDGTKFFSAYSASNGNIWVPLGSNSVNWATAEIRIRTATGESTMTKVATSGDCNSCHDSTNRITTP